MGPVNFPVIGTAGQASKATITQSDQRVESTWQSGSTQRLLVITGKFRGGVNWVIEPVQCRVVSDGAHWRARAWGLDYPHGYGYSW